MTREETCRRIDDIDYCLQNRAPDYSERDHEAMMEAKKALEQEPRWIPVSERLPEDDGEYFATVYDTDENYKYRDIAEFEDGIWQYKDYVKVLAWMPLPELYKEESER